MPLPSLDLHGAKQCRARSKRSGKQCKNPAAFGMPTCRMHGARQINTVFRGKAHPNYKHGFDTLEVKIRRARKLVDLRQVAKLISYIFR